MSRFDQESLELHAQHKGKLGVHSKIELKNKHDLSLAYSPGVAAISKAVAADPKLMYKYSPKGNMVAVVSDGSAVLGLGNIGPAGAYPVMEGKCLLFKHFGGVDAFPIVVKTQDVDEIVELVVNISDGFGGVNIEDISAPRCFEVERKLKERLSIPIFHDDQHGTAIVVLAGLINALKVTGKNKDSKIVLNGAGAAGIAIAKLLLAYGFTQLTLLDSRGAIYEGREENMNPAKDAIALQTNLEKRAGTLAEMLIGTDVFLGVSKANLVSQEMVKSMANDPIIFAMANPDPEISEADALAAGAAVVATGRSDSVNQVNNVLVFPGLFRGILDLQLEQGTELQFTQKMFVAAAEALANMVVEPRADKIIPSAFDEGVAEGVAGAVRKAA
jgi:malate dehydrogenase (oxaloacetate-decarboxylating)